MKRKTKPAYRSNANANGNRKPVVRRYSQAKSSDYRVTGWQRRSREARWPDFRRAISQANLDSD